MSKPLLGTSGQELKTPTIFLRPSQASASEQLVHARSLESRGSVRGARRAYDALVHRWHASPEAPLAQLGVARLREKAGHKVKAFAEYQYAVDYFSGHFRFEKVLERQFALANDLRGDLEKGFLGFGREAGVDEVVELFRTLARNAPGWHRAPECYLMMGLTFEAEERFDEAVTPYETLATRYPGHKLVEDAMFRAAACRYRLAKDRPRDEMTLRNALSALAATRRDYPSHPELAQVVAWTDELRGMLTRMHHERAFFYDRIRKNPGAAVVAYQEFLRMFPNAAEAESVRGRIAELAPRAARQKQPATDAADEDTP